MKTFIIATRNAHKVEEIRAILGPGSLFKTLADYPNAPKVVEDAPTFAGNATKKSVELAKWLSGLGDNGTDLYVMADDSGLEVDALNGAPGVLSARFAALDTGGEENSKDSDNNAKLLRLMRDVPTEKRTARFRCVIAVTPVAEPVPSSASPACSADEFELGTELFDGTCEGAIQFEPSGKSGFGYDPLFVPRGFSESFAEIGEEAKNRISHRGHALAKLRKRLGEKN